MKKGCLIYIVFSVIVSCIVVGITSLGESKLVKIQDCIDAENFIEAESLISNYLEENEEYTNYQFLGIHFDFYEKQKEYEKAANVLITYYGRIEDKLSIADTYLSKVALVKDKVEAETATKLMAVEDQYMNLYYEKNGDKIRKEVLEAFEEKYVQGIEGKEFTEINELYSTSNDIEKTAILDSFDLKLSSIVSECNINNGDTPQKMKENMEATIKNLELLESIVFIEETKYKEILENAIEISMCIENLALVQEDLDAFDNLKTNVKSLSEVLEMEFYVHYKINTKLLGITIPGDSWYVTENATSNNWEAVIILPKGESFQRAGYYLTMLQYVEDTTLVTDDGFERSVPVYEEVTMESYENFLLLEENAQWIVSLKDQKEGLRNEIQEKMQVFTNAGGNEQSNEK